MIIGVEEPPARCREVLFDRAGLFQLAQHGQEVYAVADKAHIIKESLSCGGYSDTTSDCA